MAPGAYRVGLQAEDGHKRIVLMRYSYAATAGSFRQGVYGNTNTKAMLSTQHYDIPATAM